MKKKIFIIPVILAVFLLISSSVVITKPGEYRVIKQFGKIIRVEENDGSDYGVSWKIPFVQSETVISSKMRLSDLPASDVMTSDKKSMISDCFVLWKIEDPVKFIQKLSGSQQNAESRISSNVYNALKNVISSLSQEEVISGRDGELALVIKNNIGDTIEQYGITLLAVETKSLDLPDENKDAVYERMISERDNIAATYTAEGSAEAQVIRNTTDKEVAISISEAKKQAEILVAEGEAEYMRILAEAYDTEEKQEFYSFVRSLDALRESMTGADKTVILSADSPIAEIFSGYEE